MPKFFIKTYGCQMNERDSEQVAHSLITRGYERVAHEADADVVLLNTCSVRDMADQKALGKMGMLGRLAKDRPHVVFGFLGAGTGRFLAKEYASRRSGCRHTEISSRGRLRRRTHGEENW
jgi:tRNA A37 methylthiotransferase MiaB